jgi:hypothetical protein
MSETKTEFIQGCNEDLKEATELLTQFENLSSEQANWKPGPKRWSVSECIRHLNQSIKAYRDNLDAAMAKLEAGKKPADAPSGRGTWVGRWLIGALDPANAKKLKAGGPFKVAASEYDLTSELTNLREQIDWLTQQMKAADGLDSGLVKLRTPVFLKISLAQAFKVHSVHTLRHVKQAQVVMQQSGFPA